jgi:hypothetical protein
MNLKTLTFSKLSDHMQTVMETLNRGDSLDELLNPAREECPIIDDLIDALGYVLRMKSEPKRTAVFNMIQRDLALFLALRDLDQEEAGKRKALRNPSGRVVRNHGVRN